MQPSKIPTLDKNKDPVVIKVNLNGENGEVSINSMIDSGATEDFIDTSNRDKHQIYTKLAETPREISLADRNLSEIGPITHTAEVTMKIGGNQELSILQVANLQNNEIILEMAGLKDQNPKIDSEK